MIFVVASVTFGVESLASNLWYGIRLTRVVRVVFCYNDRGRRK